jgi:hypothetical protein
MISILVRLCEVDFCGGGEHDLGAEAYLAALLEVSASHLTGTVSDSEMQMRRGPVATNERAGERHDLELTSEFDHLGWRPAGHCRANSSDSQAPDGADNDGEAELAPIEEVRDLVEKVVA